MLYKQIRHWLTTGCIGILVVLTGFANTYAQGTPPAGRTCAAMDVLTQQLAKDPDMANRMAELESFTRQYIEQRSLDSLSGLRTLPVTRTIPVYVHVLYQTDLENIDAAQIQSQITVLNQDFRHMASTPGYGDTGYGLGVDTNIEFVLAPVPVGSTSGGIVDPYGINRKYVNRDTWGTDDEMKKYDLALGLDGIAPVTPDTHMNMWICDIGPDIEGNIILGYAQFPGGTPETDGVVFSPQYCGSSDIYPAGYYGAPYDKGRTATHEVGHYLNLRHIWGDGGCGVIDYVTDTPDSDNPNFGCTPRSGCGSVDMIENYMDYTDDACMNTFTRGQSDRFTAALTYARADLGGSCTDGVKNGDETAIDCGGSCTACAPCIGTVSFTLTTDNWGSETTWQLERGATLIESGGPYTDNNQLTSTYNWSLAPGDYIFTINDKYGDGICCSEGSGEYSLSGRGCGIIASGGAFGISASHSFTVTAEGKVVIIPTLMMLLNKN